MEELNKITTNDLSGEQKEFAEIIGIETYLHLVRLCGGSTIYIAKEDKVIAVARNRRIKKAYNGYNISQLSKQYGLTERRIRDIVYDDRDEEYRDEDIDENKEVFKNQISMFSLLEK